MENSIIPECYNDTCLIESITRPNRGYNHIKGTSSVTKRMKEKHADSFALGIIDNDKRPNEYLAEFNVLISFNNSLILYKHTSESKHHYIIHVSPEVEPFIISSAQQVNIIFPTHLLAKEELRRDSQKFADRKNLHKQILNAGSMNYQILTFWITYLRDNNYNADLDYLIKQTNAIINS